MVVATAWVVAGLDVMPWLTAAAHLQGAAVWPLLAWCVLRSGKGDMFAAIWVAVATLEIAGPGLGTGLGLVGTMDSPGIGESALRDRRRLRRDRRLRCAARPGGSRPCASRRPHPSQYSTA